MFGFGGDAASFFDMGQDKSIGAQRECGLDRRWFLYRNFVFVQSLIVKLQYRRMSKPVRRSNEIDRLIARFVRECPNEARYVDRLNEELNIIETKGFVKCFNQVRDIIEFLEAKSIPHVLRGSGASSLVCYLLNITSIDPVKEGMALSRFMNSTREDQPDIDIDVPHWIRPKILEYCYAKWPNQVARISNNVKYREKTALRKVLKDHGVKGRIPKYFKVEDYIDDPQEIAAIHRNASELIGNHRHWSLHCGGIIVYDNGVPEDLVLKDNQIKVTKYDVDEQNLIKIDLLCNRGLSQLWDIDGRSLDSYPYEDEKISDLLAAGDVIGLTQAESPTMRKALMAIKPKNYRDVALALALIRPAAADRGRKSLYLRSLSKGEQRKMMVYDDDSIFFIADAIGCSMDEADAYRRAFKKGDQKLIEEFYEQLRPKRHKEMRVKQLSDLNKYSFCKGHSLAYGQLVWALAYHKTYNPKKFWESTTKFIQSSYRPWVHKRAAQNAGVFLRSKNYKMTSTQQFLKQGWWQGKDFLPGCFLERVDAEEDIWAFRGLVAQMRNTSRYGKSFRFLTIGYANDKFINVSVPMNVWDGNYKIVSAAAKRIFKDDQEYYEVIKMWKTWVE